MKERDTKKKEIETERKNVSYKELERGKERQTERKKIDRKKAQETV